MGPTFFVLFTWPRDLATGAVKALAFDLVADELEAEQNPPRSCHGRAGRPQEADRIIAWAGLRTTPPKAAESPQGGLVGGPPPPASRRGGPPAR